MGDLATINSVVDASFNSTPSEQSMLVVSFCENAVPSTVDASFNPPPSLRSMLVVSFFEDAVPSIVNTPSKGRVPGDAVPSDVNSEPSSSVQELEFQSLLQLVAKTTELILE